MKKYIIAIFALAALFVSCNKEPKKVEPVEGTLSFAAFTVNTDDALQAVTKAVSPASGNYTIIILDSEGEEVVRKTYSQVKENDYKISLPAGNYTLVARSTAEEVPYAEFEQPVYGATKAFSIVAGETTAIGQITCTLLQVKVSVAYSDDFLTMVTGDCSTKVEVTAGHPLTYALSADGTYDQSAGYFAVNGTTMEVSFTGYVNGSYSPMTKSFTGIAARQWRQIKFVPKVNAQGNADFDIEINDFVEDETLANIIGGNETVLGEDPTAPKGDGGIEINFDYEAGCDAEFTDFSNVLIPDPNTGRDICLALRATVPGGVKKFTVDIASTNESFLSACDAAVARHLDLINPLPDNEIIFQVVPFPHGSDLLGLTDVRFDLSTAQDAIYIYPGVHTFTMTVTDSDGCKKAADVVMIVE